MKRRDFLKAIACSVMTASPAARATEENGRYLARLRPTGQCLALARSEEEGCEEEDKVIFSESESEAGHDA